MVRNVRLCVVFMSPEYANSPNCCVEFWEAVQEPQKLVVCTLRSMPPETQRYLAALAGSGARLCNGFDELLPILNSLITDTEDMGA